MGNQYTRDEDNGTKGRRPANPNDVYKHSQGDFWFSRGEYRTQPQAEVVAQPPRLFKVLTDSGKAPYVSSFVWPLPKQEEDGSWTPGDWKSMEGRLVFCERGYHAFDANQWQNWTGNGTRLFEIEFDGPVGKIADKYIGARARLIREIPYQVVKDASLKLDPYRHVDTREEVQARAASAAYEAARNEFNGQGAQATFSKAKAKLGPLADEAEKALQNGQRAWESFINKVAIRTAEMREGVANIQSLTKWLTGKDDLPAEVTDRLAEIEAINKALPNLKWGVSAEPWKDTAVTFAAVQAVGATWYAEYVKRTKKNVEDAREKAGVEFDTKPAEEKVTFETLVDAAIADTVVVKATIPGTLADVQANASKKTPTKSASRRGR